MTPFAALPASKKSWQWHWRLVVHLVILWPVIAPLAQAASAATAVESSIAAGFDAWLDANGAHRAVSARDYRVAGLGFGFEATRALRAGDRALLVPLRLHVAASNALRRSSAAPWFFSAEAQQHWSFAEQPFVLFWLHEAAVRGRDSFYAPYLRLMATSMRCPHRGSDVDVATASLADAESSEMDPSPNIESTRVWQRAWAWLDADRAPDCTHPLYWSGGAAELSTAFQRASVADDVMALRRSLRARYRDTIDRLIAPHAARTGLAPAAVTFRDFVWAFLLHGSRTWALPRFQPPPADADSLRALRAELAARHLVQAPSSSSAACVASSSPDAATAGAGGASVSCSTTGRDASVPNAASAAAAFVPPWADADEREAAITASEGHTFLPGIDVFNHVRADPDVAMRVTPDGLYAEAVALRPIAAGAQVWISYGTQANIGLLLGFNFALAPIRFRALAPFAARGDAEFEHETDDTATTTTTTTMLGADRHLSRSGVVLDRLHSLIAVAADYLSEPPPPSSSSASSRVAASAASRRNSAIAFQPVRSNVTVLTLSVSLPHTLLVPPLVAIFAAAGVDAHNIQVPVTAAPSSLDALLKFLRIMHLTTTHELIPPPVSTDAASQTTMTPDANASNAATPTSSAPPPSPSSARPAARSPLEHCVAHLLSAAAATSTPLSLPNELAALRRARQLADEVLRSYATSARSDAARLFEDRFVALLSAAMAEAEAAVEAAEAVEAEAVTRTVREVHDTARVEETATNTAVVAENNGAPPSVGSARTMPLLANSAAAAAAAANHANDESAQPLRRRLATALTAARSARDRLRPLDAMLRAALSVRLEEKLALEALRDRVRARWLRILETGVLHAGAVTDVADGGGGHDDDGGDADGHGGGDSSADAAASSIPVAPAGFDWCARTLSVR